jgi:coenzyme F420-0:L-glutamate ligase/coenzyme F420-1:gamma-L-glutamate ligase
VRANDTGKDPRLVELMLGESRQVLRERQGLLIVEHRLGLVMANAGVDQSNVDTGCALLLPEDPDRSARVLRRALRDLTGADVGIIISDSIGRAWRNGTIGHSIGSAGILPLADLRGAIDVFDRPLQSTEVAIADEIAAAASLIMGQASEAKPVVLVRGFGPLHSTLDSRALLRPREQDMFR